MLLTGPLAGLLEPLQDARCLQLREQAGGRSPTCPCFALELTRRAPGSGELGRRHLGHDEFGGLRSQRRLGAQTRRGAPTAGSWLRP